MQLLKIHEPPARFNPTSFPFQSFILSMRAYLIQLYKIYFEADQTAQRALDFGKTQPDQLIGGTGVDLARTFDELLEIGGAQGCDDNVKLQPERWLAFVISINIPLGILQA
jgi:hypothetical protein